MKDKLKTWIKSQIAEVVAEMMDKKAGDPGSSEDFKAAIAAAAAQLDDNPYTAERFQYLMNEVSDLRIAVRALTAAKDAQDDHSDASQTKDSFSYQWAEIQEGAALLGDPEFEAQILDLFCKYSDYPRQWFKGKKVLDAGCGMGRWSYALRKLDADVTAIDQSAGTIDYVKGLFKDEPNLTAQTANILAPLPFEPEFDLVWSYGVTHHTGNTRLAVENVSKVVKPGGRLFLMIYGEPTKQHEYTEINNYVEHRRATQNMTFDEKRTYLAERYDENLVHGFFDAISPTINDLHRFDEIKDWLINLGFKDVRRTLDNRNIHMVADRAD